LKPGDIVIAAFPGSQITKVRPGVVLATTVYLRTRPDVILGLITTKSPNAQSPTDCEIRDWKAAGLHAASSFRLFLTTAPQREVRVVGRLTKTDWQEVQLRVRVGMIEETEPPS
jgi:mRNA interferase MazF